MSTVILIGLLILGLAAGFYVSQKAKELAKNGSAKPVQLLYKQLRRQTRGWIAEFKRSAKRSTDDSSK